MAIRANCVALLLSSLPIAGCGTVANLVNSRPEEGGKIPFGGVKQDVYCIHKAANGDFSCKTPSESESEPKPQVAPLLFFAADLPFTLLGDFVTWPYTATYTFINAPVPVPPMTLAPAEVRPQPASLPENKELKKKKSDKDTNEAKPKDKDAKEGKPKEDDPSQLPLPLPLPRKLNP